MNTNKTMSVCFPRTRGDGPRVAHARGWIREYELFPPARAGMDPRMSPEGSYARGWTGSQGCMECVFPPHDLSN